jgi:hypothetical protein
MIQAARLILKCTSQKVTPSATIKPSQEGKGSGLDIRIFVVVIQ